MPARATIVSEATIRPGWSLASSARRAASLTGSPMTVYSKRSAAPTFPATTVPAESPIAARISGRSHTTRACISRPAASAPPAASSELERNAEDTERGVALELVDEAAVPARRLHNDPEERVEHRNDLGRAAVRGE